MNKPQIFSHVEFGEVQIIQIDGKELFAATQVATILGYSNPRDAIAKHCREEGVAFYDVPTSGGTQQMKFIDEGNVYRLIVRSKLPSTEKFERWVFDEVLPSIRQHGGYLTPKKIEEVLLNPDTIIDLAQRLKQANEERAKLATQIEQDKPKVLFAEALETSSNSILIGELAKLLKQNGVNIGQNRLFERLRNEGYLMKTKDERWNDPTQKALELGLFEIKKRTINGPDGTVRTVKTTKVTGKGQIYFINKYKAGAVS
ncbi:phage antirepressor KilAC domain-containing protein [Brevibacillus agri]|uniref:phage antirepressor n=1 Tax=Brevibacillus agri TaxID=51101 RepID=UPI002E1D20D1|nr:phage antirepressor KilAC domain-containing protein [Brevibacillus agri]MED1643686.1 phage antirepressor KilAC domain-containing protein [Brevibacillus agri]MED1653874.1 phage antirepressor KilAC domain-containing protein [Brevibacillus agri]MED1686713.1 phage antirepressor KilAC domain-containing protein [Brevibacillus agri]MED1691972.1 phage antirepressor KilAC domain-containing protein [Brevibacillus agri]MED1696029.1 phage antirepressor KilAC domain-containing protein [Brevibacillus agr